MFQVRATQLEVARRANVSQTTVSLILGNSTTQSFPGETLERVLKAARDLGYVPNRLAQALKTQSDANRERRVLQWGLEGRVDGIIGVFFTLRARDFEPLTRAGVGILRIETSAKKGGNMPIDDLFVDNVAAATAATRYLLERGHTR